MNKGLLWRGGTAQVIFALLLLVGVALGWRAHQTREQTIDRTARLAALKDRICSSVLQVGDGIQAMLLDAKSDPGRKRCHEAQSDLAKAIDSLQFEFPKEAELLSTAKNLHALHGGIVDQAESDASGAMSIYRKNYLLIQDQRGELLNKLNQQADQFSAAAWAQAKAGDLVLIVGVGFVLVLGLLMAWWQSAAMSKSLAGLAGTLDYMRRGDFTRRVAVDGPGPFSVVGEGLNRLAEDLSALVSQVQTAGLQVNSTATRIAATVREQQGTASEIADSTAEIEATSKQISTTSRELVKTIDEVSQVAKETAQLANSGQTGIARMEATMRHIMEASGAISSKLAVLSEKNANINTVVTTIAKVADQTNLLSLNAAIEAEKAGEYGLGFAVVAMEIRRLADQTAVATFDIEKTVKEMQTAVAGGVMGMDKFTDEVRRGVEEIRQVSTQLGQIIHQVQILTSRFQNVNEGMHGQALGAQEISQTLAELSKAAQQTADSLHQSNLAIEHLNAAVQGLQTSVVRLKLED